MKTLLGAAYAGAGRIARALVALAPRSERKLWRALAGRRGLVERFEAWAATRRDATRPLLWMHAPSVGEGLQARVVLERVRERRPDVQIVYTFFSPSAERFAASVPADLRDYIPIDTVSDVRRALDALRPTAIVFSKLDVWPTLVSEAAARGVRLGLISGTLAPGSSRRGRMALALLSEAYQRLDRIGAITGADADRLVALGAHAERVRVTGDTRYDQVWARARAARPDGPLLGPLASGRPTLVAGSTWPPDEDVLLPAWERVRGSVSKARLIIAPHEPTVDNLRPVERRAERAGLAVARLGALPPGASAHADVVLIDRVGVLGELYAPATCAFIGGGFHAAGLHSVLEPAAFGVPVVFGPRHGDSADAAVLLAAGAAQGVSTPNGLAACVIRWLGDPPAREAAGAAARSVVQSGLGAAERSYEMVAELLALT
ncbi:MAG: 3-deoxy-D-manno-octulosonic acid transferase [Gemmatimonadaceae bacterium]